jgi:thioredoxin reductase (NADPH)
MATVSEEEYDVIIFGSGPAGLQAAVHGARSQARVAVLGRLKKSSLHRAHIENYCCMDSVVTGDELLEEGKRQAERFGAAFLEEDVVDVREETDGRFAVVLESGRTLKALALILAMGISRNRLNVPGEKELLGKGVSYCVECDAQFFKGQTVTVVGNESAGATGALTLLMIAGEVHHVYRELQVSENLREQVERSAVHRHPGRWVKAILGTGSVEKIVLDNGEEIESAGIFIELGAKGALEIATRLGVALDPEKFSYVVTGKKQETNIPGIYAAGDICGPPWQMAKSVGEGCIAGLEAASHAKQKKRKAGS